MFVEDPGQLEELKGKRSVKVRAIHRNKGLGEMSPEAWRYVMSKGDYMVIEEGDAREAKKMLDVCFGKDSGAAQGPPHGRRLRSRPPGQGAEEGRREKAQGGGEECRMTTFTPGTRCPWARSSRRSTGTTRSTP